MKRIFFILAIFVCGYVNSQVLGADMLNLRAKSEAEMNAITVSQGLQEGSLLFRTDLKTVFVYNGTSWNQISGSGGLSTADIDTFSELDAIVADETLAKASDIGVTVQPFNANTDIDATDDVLISGIQNITGSKIFTNISTSTDGNASFFNGSTILGGDNIGSANSNTTVINRDSDQDTESTLTFSVYDGGFAFYRDLKATIDDITYNGVSLLGGGGGATQLSDLTDVNTSTTTNRNVLVADGTDWESRPLVKADISDLGVDTDDQTAPEVPIVDAGGYYTSTEVEGMGQEIGAAIAALDADGDGLVDGVEDGAITNSKLGPSAVTNDKILNNEITGAKIANATILSSNIANGAVNSDRIENGSILPEDIDATNTPTTNQIPQYNGTNVTWADMPSGSLSADDQNRLANSNKSPVSVELSADVNLSTLDQNVTSGADIGRKVINAESGANEISITVDDTGNVDDIWRFRTDNASAIINLISDTGVTINFIGSQGEEGAKLEGFDQYVILRKTATNTYTASGNMVGYDATAVATASVDESLGDGEETTSSGSVANGSGALNLNDAQAVLTVFSGLSIPAGATIVSAVVTFEASATDSDAISQNINVESADAALSNTNNSSITNRTTTATTVAWSSIESWTDGGTYDTPDISAAVQEWVDRGGYDSSDNLGVIFSHLSGSGERAAISWNGTGLAPSISITYTN